MTDPGVSPTAIEIAAEWLWAQKYPTTSRLRSGSALSASYLAEGERLIRALVDSRELVTKEQYEGMRAQFSSAEEDWQSVCEALSGRTTDRDRLAAEVTHWKAKRDEAVSLYAARGEYLAEARAEVDRLAAEITRQEAEYADLVARTSALGVEWSRMKSEVERLSQANTRLVEAIQPLLGIAETHAMQTYDRSGTTGLAIERARAVLGEFIQEGEPVPPNMVSVEVPRTGRPNDRYWVRREPPAQEGERP